MKYVKEIVIIFGITMVGELLNKFIPLPVPAGVYGLFILLGGLCSGIIKLSGFADEMGQGEGCARGEHVSHSCHAGDVYPGGCGNY